MNFRDKFCSVIKNTYFTAVLYYNRRMNIKIWDILWVHDQYWSPFFRNCTRCPYLMEKVCYYQPCLDELHKKYHGLHNMWHLRYWANDADDGTWWPETLETRLMMQLFFIANHYVILKSYVPEIGRSLALWPGRPGTCEPLHFSVNAMEVALECARHPLLMVDDIISLLLFP